MKIEVRPNEAYTLKLIGEDTTSKHNGSLELMVYDDKGEYETNISVYGKWHKNCKEKGYLAQDGKVYKSKDDAIFASLKEKTDYDPRRDY